MTKPIVYGAAYSVYVRAVRLALTEKSVPYDLVEVDVFRPGGPPAEHRSRHPFGKIPAFEHDGFLLYETGAITRYVDEAFPGPSLQPANVHARARMNQAISVQDNYVYRDLVWGIYVERAEAARRGRQPDEAMLACRAGTARTCLAALNAILGEGPWLAGGELSLADLHAAPMFDLFLRTPEGADLMPRHGLLAAWWRAMADRPSLAATAT
jgi:glutathione S-transferase